LSKNGRHKDGLWDDFIMPPRENQVSFLATVFLITAWDEFGRRDVSEQKN